jgi:hypothetical protein
MSTVKTYYLKREMEVKDGIWGVLTDDEGLELYTLENADKKIPDGKYDCTRDWYYRGDYETFEVQVKGRDRILVHAANYPDQLEGCIAPGTDRGYNDGRLAVWKSKDAHKEYMESLVGHDLHTLVVTTEQESDDE